jgi:hypothetical protein
MTERSVMHDTFVIERTYPAGPVPGAVRFTDDGRLEIYGDDGWQPLLRISDAVLLVVSTSG